MSNVTISKFSDGTNTGYIASQAYFECSTQADTAAKVATSPDSVGFSNTSRVRGTTVHVKFTNTNTASSPTLQVGTSTAASIIGNAAWSAGTVVSFTFDGTSWIQNGQEDKPVEDDGAYLTFSSDSSFTLNTYNTTKNWDGTLEYSTDRFSWSVWDGTTTLSSIGNKLYLRGTGNTAITGMSGSNNRWVLTGSNISCTGNIESLLDYQTVARGEHPTMSTYCYFSMFQGCTSLTTAPELPATTLTGNCYNSMFKGCTSLTTAPKLPATTVSSFCYCSMFQGCTSLTTAPALPATTLVSHCYYKMFQGCTSLTTTPELPTTTLADSCYSNMFQGCTSLTPAPALPATTLADNCYYYMFDGCTSLISAPALPATSLSRWCYAYMFQGCTSLTTAPELPATTLADYCYYYMFYGCTFLTTALALPATTLADSCYYYMFYGCTKIKLSSSQTADYQTPYRIPSSGTGTAGTYSLTYMFSSTGGTFKSTPSINTTYYLSTSNSVVYPDTYIEYTPNKVTTIDSNSTDLQYPSAKAVYDLFTSITDADNQSY